MESFDTETVVFWAFAAIFVIAILQFAMVAHFIEKIKVTNTLLENMSDSLSEMNDTLNRIEDDMYRPNNIDHDFYAENGGV